MATSHFQVSGLRELGENFAQLDQDMQKRSARTAARAGAKVIADSARTMAPMKTGTLRRAISPLRSKKESGVGLEVWAIGVSGGKAESTYAYTVGKKSMNIRLRRVGKKYTWGDAYYWKFLEFGTVKMEARPFLRPALDQSKGMAVDALASTLDKQIQLSLRKMKRATRPGRV